MRVTGQEAKPACGTEQLVVGVEVGINGGVYAMLLLWVHQSQEEEWGFLLIDARKSFNEDNWMEML